MKENPIAKAVISEDAPFSITPSQNATPSNYMNVEASRPVLELEQAGAKKLPGNVSTNSLYPDDPTQEASEYEIKVKPTDSGRISLPVSAKVQHSCL